MVEQNFCISCFRKLNDDDYCRYCGKQQNQKIDIQHHLQPGTIIKSRYLIGEVLNYGGFGIIYKALDTALDQIIAIKEYFPAGCVNRVPGTNEVIILRENDFYRHKKTFISEGKNTAKFFGSKNIVNVYDCIEDNNTAYIIMEFLDGINLRDFIKQNGGHLDVNSAVEITNGILEGLKELHQKGIIHKDMSPDNVMLTINQRIVIIDLGAAKFDEDSTNTNDDVVVKIGYAPPEQYHENDKQGTYTDIYAVGAMLYKMLTGILPDEANDRIEEDTLVNPQVLNDKIPLCVNNACVRALALQTGLRLQTVDQFKSALNGKVVKTPKEELKRRKVTALLTASVVAVVMVLCISLGIAFRGANSEVNLNKYIKEDTVVEIWVPYDYVLLNEEKTKTLYNSVFDEFQSSIQENDSKKKLKSNIDVELVFVNEDDYDEKLYQAYLNDNMPDVFRTDLAGDFYETANLDWVKN